MTIVRVNAGAGNVELKSNAAITDAAGDDTTTDSTGALLTIRTSAGICVSAANALNLSGNNLVITATTGAAFITEAAGIGLGTVNVVGNVLNLRAITGDLRT